MAEQSNDRVWDVPLRKNFTKIPNEFIDFAIEAGLDTAAFMLICCLARFHYNSSSGQSKPSLNTLARMTGYSARTVRRKLASLHKDGFIDIESRPGRPSVYSVKPVLPTIQTKRIEDVTPDSIVSGVEAHTPDIAVSTPTPDIAVSPEEDEVQEARIEVQEDEATSNNDKGPFLPEGKNKSSSDVGDIDMSPPSMNGNDKGWLITAFLAVFPEYELTKTDINVLRTIEDKYDKTLVEDLLLVTVAQAKTNPVLYLLKCVQEYKTKAQQNANGDSAFTVEDDVEAKVQELEQQGIET